MIGRGETMGYVRPRITLIMGALLIISAGPVMAGGFADLYVGGAFHQDEEISYKGAEQRISYSADPDTGFTVGYRMGYWFDSIPWLGIALEGSYYTHDTDVADVTVFPLSALLMIQAHPGPVRYREPIWIPYAGIGPALFLATIDYDVADSPVPGMLDVAGLSGDYEDDTSEVGLDVRAGIRYMFRENMGLFGEYRFTSFSPDFDESVLGTKIKTAFDANTHHVLVGLNYAF